LKKFKVLLSQTAVNELENLPIADKSRIKLHLKELEDNPFRPRPKADIKKLSGFSKPDLYRLRIGNWRIIYVISENEVRVTEIMQRNKGYSWLE